MASEAPLVAKSGVTVWGLAELPMTKRPPGWPGSHLAMSGEGGRGCALGWERPGLPQPASARTSPRKARGEQNGAIIVMTFL